MQVFKGDVVQLVSGAEGEVIETWGYTRLFVRIRTDCGKIIPAMDSDVASKMPKKPTWGGGVRREKRKKANT